MEEKKKPISEMTEREILRQQLELLAERSRSADDVALCEISKTMLIITCYLSSSDESVL